MEFKFTKNGFVNKHNTYTFGSKLYPVASKKQGRYITHEDTEQMPDTLKEQIDEALKGIDMPTGKCYQNANVMFKTLKKVIRGYKVEFYSGWLFAVPDFPMHHAFVVIDKKYVLDPGIRVEEYMLIRTVVNMSKSMDKVALANSLKNINNNINAKKFSEAYICGKPLKEVCYYASPDSYDNAVSISTYIINMGLKHPSMVAPMLNIMKGTHIQQLMSK